MTSKYFDFHQWETFIDIIADNKITVKQIASQLKITENAVKHWINLDNNINSENVYYLKQMSVDNKYPFWGLPWKNNRKQLKINCD